jgi:fatty acid desaturase
MSSTTLAVLLGFAAVVVWAALGLGWAVLAIVVGLGAGLVTAFVRGDLDAEDLRRRADAARSGFSTPPVR